MKMCMNLNEEQFSEWEDLKRRYAPLRQNWQRNIRRNKQRLNTVKREDVLVSLVRRLQGFDEVLDENRGETRRQNEVQDAVAREQKQKEIAQVQRRHQERATKRQKVRDETNKSGGISV